MRALLILISIFFISFSSFPQRLYFMDREHPEKIDKIYVVKNVGFVKNLIDNSGTKTVLRSDFQDTNGERINEHASTIPKSEYLGHAFNGIEHFYFFLDTYNNFLYVPKYKLDGSYITTRKSKITSKVKHADLIYYDSVAFYTVRRKGPTFTFTKISYNLDTLWTQEVFDNGTTTIFKKAEKCGDSFYLIFNFVPASGRVVSVDDSLGKKMFDIETGPSIAIASVEEDSLLVLTGWEILEKSEKNFSSGLYINKMDNKGKFVKKESYPVNKAIMPSQLDHKMVERLKSAELLDMVKVNKHYYFVAENRFRTDFAGEGLIATMIAASIGMPFTSAGFDNIVYTNLDLMLIKAGNDSLEYITIEKGPIARYFPTINSSFNRKNTELFDYKFLKKGHTGVEIFFFQDLTKENFTLGSVLISPNSPPTVKKVVLNESNQRGKNYNLYDLSDNSILVQYKSNSSTGYGVVDLSRFE